MIKRLIFDVDNTLIVNASFTQAKADTLRYFNLYSEENMQGFDEAIFTYESIYNSYNEKDYAEHLGKCINSKIPDGFFDVFFDKLQYVIPDECVMIGDSIKLDIICAKEAGLNTILVNTKKQPVDIDTIVVDSVEDINDELIEKAH